MCWDRDSWNGTVCLCSASYRGSLQCCLNSCTGSPACWMLQCRVFKAAATCVWVILSLGVNIEQSKLSTAVLGLPPDLPPKEFTYKIILVVVQIPAYVFGSSRNWIRYELKQNLLGNDRALFLRRGTFLTYYCSLYQVHPDTLVLVRLMPQPNFHNVSQSMTSFFLICLAAFPPSLFWFWF